MIAWCYKVGHTYQSHNRLEYTEQHLLEAKCQRVSGSMKSNLLSFFTLGLHGCNLLLRSWVSSAFCIQPISLISDNSSTGPAAPQASSSSTTWAKYSPQKTCFLLPFPMFGLFPLFLRGLPPRERVSGSFCLKGLGAQFSLLTFCPFYV